MESWGGWRWRGYRMEILASRIPLFWAFTVASTLPSSSNTRTFTFNSFPEDAEEEEDATAAVWEEVEEVEGEEVLEEEGEGAEWPSPFRAEDQSTTFFDGSGALEEEEVVEVVVVVVDVETEDEGDAGDQKFREGKRKRGRQR